MLSKNDLPFSDENLRKSYLADLQKTYKNLTTNLGKILRSFENQAPDCSRMCRCVCVCVCAFLQHHCRECGRVFCWVCCNNWVETPHSEYVNLFFIGGILTATLLLAELQICVYLVFHFWWKFIITVLYRNICAFIWFISTVSFSQFLKCIGN